MIGMLERRGILQEGDRDTFADEQPAFAGMVAASVLAATPAGAEASISGVRGPGS